MHLARPNFQVKKMKEVDLKFFEEATQAGYTEKGVSTASKELSSQS